MHLFSPAVAWPDHLFFFYIWMKGFFPSKYKRRNTERSGYARLYVAITSVLAVARCFATYGIPATVTQQIDNFTTLIAYVVVLKL